MMLPVHLAERSGDDDADRNRGDENGGDRLSEPDLPGIPSAPPRDEQPAQPVDQTP